MDAELIQPSRPLVSSYAIDYELNKIARAMVSSLIQKLEFRKADLEKLAKLREEVEGMTRKSLAVGESGEAVLAVAEIVAAVFKVTVADLMGRPKPAYIATPRLVLYYLLRETTELSTNEIGKLVGNRDHGTVMHGCKVIKGRIETDTQFAARVATCRNAAVRRLELMQAQQPQIGGGI